MVDQETARQSVLRWTRYRIQQTRERTNWMAAVAEFERQVNAGADPDATPRPPGYNPYAGGRMGSYAQDDPLGHESSRNRYRLKSGGPQMWIEDSDDDVLLLYWFENNKLRTGAFRRDEVDDVSSREPKPQFYPIPT